MYCNYCYELFDLQFFVPVETSPNFNLCLECAKWLKRKTQFILISDSIYIYYNPNEVNTFLCNFINNICLAHNTLNSHFCQTHYIKVCTQCDCFADCPTKSIYETFDFYYSLLEKVEYSRNFTEKFYSKQPRLSDRISTISSSLLKQYESIVEKLKFAKKCSSFTVKANTLSSIGSLLDISEIKGKNILEDLFDDDSEDINELSLNSYSAKKDEKPDDEILKLYHSFCDSNKRVLQLFYKKTKVSGPDIQNTVSFSNHSENEFWIKGIALGCSSRLNSFILIKSLIIEINGKTEYQRTRILVEKLEEGFCRDYMFEKRIVFSANKKLVCSVEIEAEDLYMFYLARNEYVIISDSDSEPLRSPILYFILD